MKKRLVIVKHPSENTKYLFELPPTEYVRAGEYALCDTCRGQDQVALCLCDHFDAEGYELDAICRAFNTDVDKLRMITARLYVSRFRMPDIKPEPVAKQNTTTAVSTEEAVPVQ